MKVYISGKISGLNFVDAFDKFAESESFLEILGMEVVNPMTTKAIDILKWKLENPLITDAEIWDRAMVIDIEHLLPCDAIYMQADWSDSKGARIEKYISEQTGKMVLYETILHAEHVKIIRIKEAIEYATGLKFQAYTTPSRYRDGYFARMLFAKNCLDCEEFTDSDVSALINRKPMNVRRCIAQYHSEIKVNKKFKDVAKKVNNYLINNVSQ